MRALRGRHRNPRIVGMKILAVKRERLRLAERRAQIIDEFQRRRLALAVVEPERPEVIGIDAGHQAKLHAAAEHLIDDGDFFRQPQRMIERDDIAHRPNAQPLSARAGADRIKARRRHPAFVGPEMMLDAERIIEAELVARGQFAPQLLVTLMRRHPGLGPDVGEVREFHGAGFAALSKFVKLACQPQPQSSEGWCPWRESNPHSLRNTILSRARLPVPPHGHPALSIYSTGAGVYRGTLLAPSPARGVAFAWPCFR